LRGGRADGLGLEGGRERQGGDSPNDHTFTVSCCWVWVVFGGLKVPGNVVLVGIFGFSRVVFFALGLVFNSFPGSSCIFHFFEPGA
jgi:hypothetical protein